MAQQAGTGSLDQVARMLAAMAQSPAFTTEVQAMKVGIDPGGLSYRIFDANGATLVIDLDDVSLPDLSWVQEAFTDVLLAEGQRIEPPYPKLRILARPGGFQTLRDGEVLRAPAYQGQIFHIDATVIANQDQPSFAEREALLMARAFERLVRRNESLGGLVQLIQPRGPIEVETQTAKPGDVAAARCALEAFTLAE